MALNSGRIVGIMSADATKNNLSPRPWLNCKVPERCAPHLQAAFEAPIRDQKGSAYFEECLRLGLRLPLRIHELVLNQFLHLF